MNARAQIVRHIMVAAAVAIFVLPSWAQTPAPLPTVDAQSPVGRWVAEHPSKGGIASWWEFRADGTLTLYFGVMVSDPIDRSGDTFMMPSGKAGGERVRARYTISNNVLTIETAANHSTTYSRLGAPSNPADPLLGNWRPLPSPADAGSDSNLATMQKLMTTKGVLTFTPDGMRHLRAPFGTREGTWVRTAGTFQIKGDPVLYSFSHVHAKLLLAQPPDGKHMDSYLPDPLPAAVTDMTPAAQNAPAAGTPGASGVRPPGPDLVRPTITHAVEPSFTEEARKRGIRGTVDLEVIVEADGHIRAPRILKSAAEGYSDPADREAARTLDQKAIDAVNQYTFAPGTLHGKPVPIAAKVEVSFQIF